MASMKKDCIAHHSKLVYWFLLLEWQNDSYIIVNIYIYIYIYRERERERERERGIQEFSMPINIF